MLRSSYVNVALRQLNAETPTVDCFAERVLHLWPEYWGPGSPY